MSDLASTSEKAKAIVAEMQARDKRNGFLTDWWREKLADLAAALASPAPAKSAGSPSTSGVGVRPLEWVDRIVDDEGGGKDVAGSAAQTPYPQQYWTSLHYEEDGKWRLYFGLSIIGRFEKEDAAKAAAQADYAARIRSALVYHSDPSRDTQPALLSTDETKEGGNG